MFFLRLYWHDGIKLSLFIIINHTLLQEILASSHTSIQRAISEERDVLHSLRHVLDVPHLAQVVGVALAVVEVLGQLGGGVSQVDGDPGEVPLLEGLQNSGKL